MVLAGGIVWAASIAGGDGGGSADSSSETTSTTRDDGADEGEDSPDEEPVRDDIETVALTGGIHFPEPPLPEEYEFYKPPRAGEWGWGAVADVSKSAQSAVMDYYESLLPELGWELDDLVKDTPQADFTQVWRPVGFDGLLEINSFSAAGTYTLQVYVCPPAKWCGAHQ